MHVLIAGPRRDRTAPRHYENFPVASLLLPRRLRRAVAALYAFARAADDVADEGELTDHARLALLDQYAAGLDTIRRNEPPDSALFRALADAVRLQGLRLDPLYRLLAAFRQDVRKRRYANFDELLDYCAKSANPVGRALLQLIDRDTPANIARSDAVCTALQLVNILQDVHTDYARGRIYLPRDEMRRYGVGERHIAARLLDDRWQAFMRAQIDRAGTLLRHGAPLVTALPGRIGLEIRLTVAGGLRVLEKLARRNECGSGPSARLTGWDWLRVAGRALVLR